MDRIKRELLAAHRYSYAAMALNYYSLYELMNEDSTISGHVKHDVARLHPLLLDFLNGTAKTEQLDHLRNRVIHVMEVITAYTDCFQLYEYVFNRMERRYEDSSGVDDDVEVFANRIMRFLQSSHDAVIQNNRIKQVVEQLPVRYTKQKFYQLLKDGMSVYIGSEQKSLEDMMYILRTNAMVQLPADMEQGYEDLFGILQQLGDVDYLHMDKDVFQTGVERIKYAADRILGDAGVYMLLQDVINDFYVLLLTGGEAMMVLDEKQTLEQIVRGVLNCFQEGNTFRIEEEITDLLCELEGIQESAMERYLSSLAAEESADGAMASISKKVGLLLSGSPFVSLDESALIDGGESVSRLDLELKLDGFCGELDALFAGTSKPVVRAIMSKLLSSLPVVFGSAKELREYIVGSLKSCTDIAEREAAMELILQEIEHEDAFL